MKIKLESCLDMHQKLQFEYERLKTNNWHEYDLFNFLVTTWHLFHDWISQSWMNRPKWAQRKRDKHTPEEMMMVVNIARDITNGSKHFKLDSDAEGKKVIRDITDPEIRDWYGYFVSGPQPGVSTDTHYFSVPVLVDLLHQYMNWLFDDSIPPEQFPESLIKSLENNRIQK